MSASSPVAASLPASDPVQATTDATTNHEEKPIPRQPKTHAHSTQVQVQNRRREYLLRHPKYFDSIEHELADPVLYERLVKRHQSSAEREAEGKAKGYGRTLEADLVRGETKLSNLREDGASNSTDTLHKPAITGVDETWDQPAESKAHGLELWRLYLTNRFIQGRDEEFEYSAVDDNDEFDDLARMEAQDVWFDDEEPTLVDEAKPLQGETGVQDF